MSKKPTKSTALVPAGHEAWRGRGWRIAAVAEEEYPLGPRLIVMTGSVDYRMPWVR